MKEDKYEDFDAKLSIPPRGKGLIFKVVFDNTNGGFYCNLSRFRFEICFCFVAFRVFFMSEEHYDALQTVVTFNKICTSHKSDIGQK